MRRGLSAADRGELALLRGFLRAFGPPGAPVTEEGRERRRAWAAADWERRLGWLGLTEERAKELGYRPPERQP
jgi:hypothetical protein